MGCLSQAAIGGKARIAEQRRIGFTRTIEGVERVVPFALEQFLGEGDRIGVQRLAGQQVQRRGALQDLHSAAIGIIHLLQRLRQIVQHRLDQ